MTSTSTPEDYMRYYSNKFRGNANPTVASSTTERVDRNIANTGNNNSNNGNNQPIVINQSDNASTKTSVIDINLDPNNIKYMMEQLASSNV